MMNMQNMNGTTQEFGAPVNGGFNGGFNGGGQGGNGQRKSYPTPCSIQARPQNTTPEFLFASLVGRVYQPKIEMRQNNEGQMVKVFSCNLMTVKQASTFNYHFGPYGADSQIIPIFPVEQEVIYVTVSLWDNPKRQTVSNLIEKLNIKEGDQIFVGGRLKCTTSTNPQYAGRYFLNMSAKDFALISRSRSNSQGGGQMNGNQNQYGGQSNQGYTQNQAQYGGQVAQPSNYGQNQYGGQPNQGQSAMPTNYGNQGNPNPSFNQGGQGQSQMPSAPSFNNTNPYGEMPNFPSPEAGTINISDDDLPF